MSVATMVEAMYDDMGLSPAKSSIYYIFETMHSNESTPYSTRTINITLFPGTYYLTNTIAYQYGPEVFEDSLVTWPQTGTTHTLIRDENHSMGNSKAQTRVTYVEINVTSKSTITIVAPFHNNTNYPTYGAIMVCGNNKITYTKS